VLADRATVGVEVIGAGQVWQIASAWGDGIATGWRKTRRRTEFRIRSLRLTLKTGWTPAT